MGGDGGDRFRQQRRPFADLGPTSPGTTLRRFPVSAISFRGQLSRHSCPLRESARRPGTTGQPRSHRPPRTTSFRSPSSCRSCAVSRAAGFPRRRGPWLLVGPSEPAHSLSKVVARLPGKTGSNGPVRVDFRIRRWGAKRSPMGSSPAKRYSTTTVHPHQAARRARGGGGAVASCHHPPPGADSSWPGDDDRPARTDPRRSTTEA